MGQRRRERTLSQWYCLVAGLLLGLRGAEQLIVGASFATPGDGWRATQQLLTGTLLLLAQRDRLIAYRALVPFAIFYTVLAIVGDINGHEAFGLLPVDGRDLFVHPLYAVLALLILARGVGGHRAQPNGSAPSSLDEPDRSSNPRPTIASD
jgi:Domain of unknown function (DUF4383)